MLAQVFAGALSVVLEGLENYLFHCYDCVGLLLLIHITNSHRRIMQSRRVPVLVCCGCQWKRHRLIPHHARLVWCAGNLL